MTAPAETETEAPEEDWSEQALRLSADLAKANEALAEMREDRNAWRTARTPDSEAEAISACVKAFDAFTASSTSTGRSTGYGTAYATDTGRIGRVLRYLAERYGVELPPTVQVLCQHENEVPR